MLSVLVCFALHLQRNDIKEATFATIHSNFGLYLSQMILRLLMICLRSRLTPLSDMTKKIQTN